MNIQISTGKNSSNDKQSSILLLEDLQKHIAGIDGISTDILANEKGLTASSVIAVEVIIAGVVPKIAETIGNWLTKDRRRSLKLKVGDNELEASGLSDAEQKKLIDWFQKQAKSHFHK